MLVGFQLPSEGKIIESRVDLPANIVERLVSCYNLCSHPLENGALLKAITTMTTLYLGTKSGLLALQAEDLPSQEDRLPEIGERVHKLANFEVTSVTAREGVILVGTTQGIFRSEDGGQGWTEASSGLSQKHIRWLAFHPESPSAAFAGAEPAAIFRCEDAGQNWIECPEVGAERDKHGWWLPYSRGAGCVRGFAFHGPRAYAAVEVGGLLVSDDHGRTWRLAPGSDGKPSFGEPGAGMIHPDVHSVEAHPSSPDLVYAATGGGLYRSRDGGAHWEQLYDCYTRALWADPADPDHLIFGPADDVDSNGRIETTRDGGRTWSSASDGLPVPWRRGMVERFFRSDEDLFAVTSRGELLRADLAALHWRQVLPASSGLLCGTLA